MTASLRVATYNVHSCIGSDRRYDPGRILRVLNAIDADILALQEVRAYSRMDDQFVFFQENLAPMQGAFGPTFRHTRYKFGNALFVRGEILEARVLNLSVPPFDARSAIDCTLQAGDLRLRVIAAHLGLFRRERREQLARIGRALQTHREPLTILLGDFNIYGRERHVLHEVGAPLLLPRVRTFPAFRPIMSLDRIWTLPNGHLQSLTAYREAPARWASDHLPLVGEIVTDPAVLTHGETALRHGRARLADRLRLPLPARLAERIQARL